MNDKRFLINTIDRIITITERYYQRHFSLKQKSTHLRVPV
jgi:hypothetical protein